MQKRTANEEGAPQGTINHYHSLGTQKAGQKVTKGVPKQSKGVIKQANRFKTTKQKKHTPPKEEPEIKHGKNTRKSRGSATRLPNQIVTPREGSRNTNPSRGHTVLEAQRPG